jgi:5-methylcytosine-specific restriction endonuclease McrA
MISTQENNTIPAVKLTKKQQHVDEMFNPDEDGCSEWVSRETISENNMLDWGKNGAARHGVYFTDNRYLWEKQGKRSITALRTVGFSDDHLYGASRPIRNDIKKYYTEKGRCCVCGSNSDLVCDHKNDLYNDPRVLSTDTQTLDDFQCLCNHCNLLKSSAEQKTRVSGKRYGATNIPQLTIFEVNFVEGDETFDPNDINAFVGTYWYDPIEFMKKLKSRVI